MFIGDIVHITAPWSQAQGKQAKVVLLEGHQVVVQINGWDPLIRFRFSANEVAPTALTKQSP
ncbi:MAG TPA: hypothetical protein VJC15_00430 [Candidatus Paceibacterota bacterium]